MVLCCAGAALGQSSVSGRIVDQSTLPLPGVQVTMTPAALGPSISRTTDEDGRFSANVPQGRYTLVAELAGFKRIDHSIIVGAAPVALELTMLIAIQGDEVTV